ncbi:MAG: hypothetical protein IJH57_02040 [Mogibacterium sp.]|nr:hypothetical protein [Mogibacterium sp.]
MAIAKTASIYTVEASAMNVVSDHKAADESLTCTVCEIYPDRIEIRRYDEKGMHVLGAEGEGTLIKEESMKD